MKIKILLIVLIGMSLGISAQNQDQTVTGNLSVTGSLSVTANIESSRIILKDPNTTYDWNSIWRSGFFESDNATNAPESLGWFWGANFNHRSNGSNYRYNGQIAIKNSPADPRMYFRSTNRDGEGTWTKLIHNTGNQAINGNLLVNGDLSNGIGLGNTLTLYDNSPTRKNRVIIGADETGAYIKSTWSSKGTDAISFRNSDNIGVLNILANSTIGIGTIVTGSHQLAVEGTIGAREIRVESTGWSDFVFDKSYILRNLEEVEDFIEANKHLPDVPSEKEVLENGIALGEMDAKLLQKIEELTLYTIEQEKRINSLEKQNSKIEILEKENKLLQSLFERVSKIEEKIRE